MPQTGRTPSFFAALSAHTDAVGAAGRAAEQVIRGAAGAPVDLLFAFISGAHAEQAHAISTVLRERLNPRVLLGVSGEGVVGGPVEVEGAPAVSLLAGRLPGVRFHTFTDSDIPPIPDDVTDDDIANLAQGVGAGPDLKAMFMFVDPFSVPMVRLLPALNRARSLSRTGAPLGVLAGGLASGATAPGKARLLLDDAVRTQGLVGVSLSGDITVEALVSQGCRPIGSPLVVTRAKGNLILQLAGRPALDVIREVVQDLPPEDQERLHNSLLIGRVVNEYKDRFGRSDFLIRNIIEVDNDLKAIAVTDIVRPGTTVQLQLRDAKTASEDLLMLLDAQQLHARPAGALLFTCNARGTRLFPQPNHDAGRIISAFGPLPQTPSQGAPGGVPGEQAAKAGEAINPVGEAIPLAGFFAAGEIGPVGRAGESFLHGQTACAVLFRG